MARRCAKRWRTPRNRKAAKCWYALRAAASAIPTYTCKTAISCSAAASTRRAPGPHAAVHARPRNRWRRLRAPDRTPSGAGRQDRGLSLDRLRPMRCLQGGRREHLHGAAPSRYHGGWRLCHPRAGPAPALPDRLRAAVALFAGALMCSGLTAYAALKRLAARAARAPLLLVGLGGVGLMGLALARAMYGSRALRRRYRRQETRGRAGHRRINRFRSGRRGCAQGTAQGQRRHLRSHRFRRHQRVAEFRDRRAGQRRQGRRHRPDRGHLPDCGRHVPAQGHDHRGHQTGTLAEARELIDLVRTNKYRCAADRGAAAMAQAQATLDDLRGGKIVGRVVLTT